MHLQNVPRYFLHRLKMLMLMFITHVKTSGKSAETATHGDSIQPGILARITHYVLRYEVQGRGSFHAYIMLWIHPEDKDQVCSYITAHKPRILYYAGQSEEHDHPMAINHWSTLVYRKQLHYYKPMECKIICCCKLRYPLTRKQHVTQSPQFDSSLCMYMYYRPSYGDRNVLPYHSIILFLWNAHMNIQKVSNIERTWYLLKCANKA